METYSHEKDDYFYLSPFALDVDKVLSDIDGRPEIKSFKHFNISAIAEAGNMPIPALPNPYNNRIMEILEKTALLYNGFSPQSGELLKNDEVSKLGGLDCERNKKAAFEKLVIRCMRK